MRLLLLGLCGLCSGVLAAPVPPPATVPTAPTLSAPAAASVPWYAARIIVFRRTAPDAGDRETWPAQVPEPSRNGAIYPEPAATGAYSALEPSVRLMAIKRRLAAGGRYRIVTTLAWRQPANSSTPVSFTPLPVTAETAAIAAILPVPPLTGTARLLIVGQRPYLSLHLRLCEPTPAGIILQTPEKATAAAAIAISSPIPATTRPQARSAPPGITCFGLNQRRETTPGQPEYFDNPIFGALALVQPITAPNPPEARPETP